jgi:hypothetical protein
MPSISCKQGEQGFEHETGKCVERVPQSANPMRRVMQLQ